MSGTGAEHFERYTVRWRQSFDERLVSDGTHWNISLPDVRTYAWKLRPDAWGDPVWIAKSYPRPDRLFFTGSANLEGR